MKDKRRSLSLLDTVGLNSSVVEETYLNRGCVFGIECKVHAFVCKAWRPKDKNVQVAAPGSLIDSSC